MMSADYKKIRESVNFLRILGICKTQQTMYLSNLGCMRCLKLVTSRSYEMQSRFMIGTSTAPLEKNIPNCKFFVGYDFKCRSASELSNEIFDNQDGNQFTPKISVGI